SRARIAGLQTASAHTAAADAIPAAVSMRRKSAVRTSLLHARASSGRQYVCSDPSKTETWFMLIAQAASNSPAAANPCWWRMPARAPSSASDPAAPPASKEPETVRKTLASRRFHQRPPPPHHHGLLAPTASAASAAQAGAAASHPSSADSFPDPAARAAGYARSAIAAGAANCTSASRPVWRRAFRMALHTTSAQVSTTGAASHLTRVVLSGPIPDQRAIHSGAVIKIAETAAPAAPISSREVRRNERQAWSPSPPRALKPCTSAVCPLSVAPITPAWRTCWSVLNTAISDGPSMAAKTLVAAMLKAAPASEAAPVRLAAPISRRHASPAGSFAATRAGLLIQSPCSAAAAHSRDTRPPASRRPPPPAWAERTRYRRGNPRPRRGWPRRLRAASAGSAAGPACRARAPEYERTPAARWAHRDRGYTSGARHADAR